MKQTIPAKEILVCDFCKREDNGGGFFKMQASFHFHGHALDMYGDPAANANQVFDACDNCAIKLRNQINLFAWGQNPEHPTNP